MPSSIARIALYDDVQHTQQGQNQHADSQQGEAIQHRDAEMQDEDLADGEMQDSEVREAMRQSQPPLYRQLKLGGWEEDEISESEMQLQQELAYNPDLHTEPDLDLGDQGKTQTMQPTSL
ncbi:hypothetical protein N7524_003933 [Penicillium chrysogenum]|nr:hypothetical protein N7524_003933 [Penicillium chrysogenum]